MNHAPFRDEYQIPDYIPISTKMGFDRYSPSDYSSKILDPDTSLAVDYPRQRTLELLALEINRKKITGSIAELGVFRGNFSAIMNHLFPLSKHYLFDTFDGFSENDFQYDLEKGYTCKEFAGGFKNTSIEIVLSKMQHPENCIIKKGYFPDSIDGLEDIFSFVSLDCDLYRPTLEGLKYFYPRLTEGGYIMIHDYNADCEYWGGCKMAVYDYEKSHGKIPMVPIPDGAGTVVLTK